MVRVLVISVAAILMLAATAIAQEPQPEPEILAEVDVKSEPEAMQLKIGTYKGDTAYERAEFHEKWIPRVKQCVRKCEGWDAYKASEILDGMRDNYRNAKRIIREHEEAQAEIQSSSSSSYSGYVGGGYAIPWSIVDCESSGDYGAVNPSSGAFGAYQLMPSHFSPGGACDHLSTDPAGQDACAAILWNGGAGAGNWAQCL